MLIRYKYGCSSLPIWIVLFVAVSLMLSSCSVQKISKKEYRSLIDDSPVFDRNFTGFVLFDPQEGEELYAYNAHQYFTPASNTKIFTLFSALKELGDSIPGIRYTLAGDSLIFTGTGDPSLLNPSLPSSKVYDFLKSTDKKLFYVKGPADVQHFGSGWAWDDYNSYYSAEKSELPIYGNVARFNLKLGADTVTVEPPFFSDSVIQIEQQQAPGGLVQRSLLNNSFIFNLSRASGLSKEVTKEIPFRSSPQLAVALLSDTLRKPVTLLNNDDRQLEGVVYSIPADSLYKRMMQESDNFIAEQILLMISGRQSDTLSSIAAIRYVAENYLQDLPDRPVWADGSGLSRYNLFTPRTLVALWNKIYQEVPRERLFPLLATGGESGTIKNWYQGEQPYIYAKTGTLSNNHSLSGYLKAKSGKVLIFSFMLNNYVSNLNTLKIEMEKVLREVYMNY